MSSDADCSEVKLVDIGDEEPTVKPKTYANNVLAMKDKLLEIKQSLDWSERLDISVPFKDYFDPTPADDSGNKGEKSENDFHRELAFINQAKAAAFIALSRLSDLGLPTKRPADYFAEMAKSDNLMTKVREKLLTKKTVIERTEKARQLREQRKHGKKIQREIMEKKKSDKRMMLNALKKGKKGNVDIAELIGEKKQTIQQPAKKKNIGMRSKEKRKNEKYGYGGRKKRSKYNTAKSSSNFNESGKKNFSGGFNKGMKGKNKGMKGKNKGMKGKNKGRKQKPKSARQRR